MRGFVNPVFAFFSKAFDLAILNLLTLLCCVPVVTIGAALTAAHYTALKLRREEGHIWRGYWKSFKENIGQSTILWLILVACFVLSAIVYNIGIYMDGMFATVLRSIVLAAVILAMLLYAWVIPLQAKFINPIRATFKNAFYLAYKYFFRTLLMVLLNLLPVGTFILVVFYLKMHGMGMWLLFSLSAPIYWCVMTYNTIFTEIEETF